MAGKRKKSPKKEGDLETVDKFELYHEILENIAAGIFLVRTKDSTIIYANSAMEKIFGYSPGEMYGMHISMVNAPDDKNSEEVTQEIKRNLYANGVWRGELKYVRKDKSVFWSRVEVSMFEHPHYGEVWVTIHQDITDSKLAEAKLSESEEKYRTLVEVADDAIILTDLQGKLLFANRSYYANFSHAVKNGHLEEYSLVHPDDLPALATRISELHEKGSLVTQYRIRSKDGNWAYRSAKSTLIRNDEGEPAAILSITRDVTEQKEMEQELREGEERYRSTLDNMLEGCQIIDFNWRYVYVNETVARQGRNTKDALLYHTMMEMYPGIENTDLFVVLRDCMENRVTRQMENRFIFPDGSEGWFDLSIQPVPEGIFILSIDKTKHKRAENALQESEARARAMLHAVPDLIFRMDREGFFLDYKAKTEDLYFQTETILGKRNRDVVPPEFAELIEKQIDITLETGALQSFEYQMDVPGRGVRDYEARMTVSGENEVTAIVRDVTDSKLAETKLLKANKLLEEQLGEIKILKNVLQDQAIRDSLTGLYNRRYLDETLGRELARAQRENYPICVLMMDVDGFKGFNDTYGHKVGDQVLVMLGGLLQDHVRKGDIACRYGGDEFALVFPHARVEDALRRAREIGAQFKNIDLQIDNVQSNATLSIGISVYPEHSDNWEELLKLADDALYRAKEAGRDLVYVWD